MGKNKMGRPSWFKLFLHHKSLIEAVPDEVAGRALKAALRYFDTGEVVELDSLAGAVFAALKPHIDEAFEDFRRSVDTGRAGGQKRWSKEGAKGDRPPIGPLYHPIGVSTEAEADAEAEGEEEGEGECYRADRPPKPARFSSPSVDDVRAYCDKQGYTTIDPERFISYYAARQWRSGQTAITNWQAAVDSWNRKDINKKGSSGGRESGVDRLARMYKEEFGK